jgi:predicted RNA binding protein YcfA (HicA-like mRNA interferase family)
MSKLSPVSHSELIKGLRILGFEGPYGGGKHLYMLKGDLKLTVPSPHKQKISVDLLTQIMQTLLKNLFNSMIYWKYLYSLYP